MPSVDKTCEYVLDPKNPETWGGEEGDECYVDKRVLNEDGVWTCPHHPEDGEDRCIFHLPVEKKDDEAVVYAFLSALEEAANSTNPVTRERKRQFLGAQFNQFNLGEHSSEITTSGGIIDFSHANVRGTFYCSKMIFHNTNLVFSGIRFGGNAIFYKTKFKGKVDFADAIFVGNAKFDDARFDEWTSFKGATFGNKETSFWEAEFGGGASFWETTFGGYTRFVDAKFSDWVEFEAATFSGKTEFYYAKFDGETNFSQTIFNGETVFWESEFYKEIKFNEAAFSGKARFEEAKFCGKTRFEGTEFDKRTIFWQGKFSEDISFRNAKFGGEVDFKEAIFKRFTSFQNVIFDGNAGYNETRFCGEETNFSNATFSEDTSFKSTVFDGKANFLNARFYGDTSFLKANFNGEIFFQRVDFNEKAVFSNLKLHAARFDSADLTDTTFTNANLSNANFESALLSRTTLFGADLRGAYLSGAALGDARIDDDTVFLGHSTDNSGASSYSFLTIGSKPSCVYDPKYEGNENVKDVNKAKSVYRALEELGGRAARPRLQARCYVRRKQLQKMDYWDDATASGATGLRRLVAGTRWGRARLAETFLLYGESPWRIIGWSLGIIIIFGLIYPFELVELTDGDLLRWNDMVNDPRLIVESLLFSASVYASLPFTESVPANVWGRLVTMFERGTGVVLIAFLIFVLGRRAAR